MYCHAEVLFLKVMFTTRNIHFHLLASAWVRLWSPPLPPLLPTQEAKGVTWGGGWGAKGSSPVHWKSGKLMTADALTGRVGGVGDPDGQSV